MYKKTLKPQKQAKRKASFTDVFLQGVFIRVLTSSTLRCVRLLLFLQMIFSLLSSTGEWGSRQ